MAQTDSHAPPLLPPAIFLMGPTASGKTELAVELCRRLPCDIISVDSAMIYRGMDIGTAKPCRTGANHGHFLVRPLHLAHVRAPAQSKGGVSVRVGVHHHYRLALLGQVTRQTRSQGCLTYSTLPGNSYLHPIYPPAPCKREMVRQTIHARKAVL